VAQVVERQQHVGHHQRQIGDADVVAVRLADGRLGAADQVVAEQADRAAGERRQPLQRGDPEAVQLLGHCRVGIRVVAERHPDRRARVHPEERPAPDALPLLGGLEQERRPAAAQLEVGGHGRLAVGDERVTQRHQVVLARQLAHAVEIGSQLEVSDDAH
jgi:hypothetical protein